MKEEAKKKEWEFDQQVMQQWANAHHVDTSRRQLS
jgi:hypothetical protein